ARKECGAVNAREQGDVASDLADFVKSAAIGTATCVENVVAEEVLAKAFKGPLGESALLVHLLLGLFGNSLDDLFFESIDEVVAFFLGMFFGVDRIVEPVAILFLEILVDGLIERKRRD